MNLTVIMGIVIAVLLVTTAAAGKWAMHQSEVAATAQASAEQWEGIALTCSDSVDKAEKDAKRAQERARKALADAAKGSASAAAEITRLRGIQGATCAAAVGEVRKGLGK